MGEEMFGEPAVQAAARHHGKTPAQICLRFLLQSGISVIPKSVHEDRIKENLALFDFALTEEEMTAITALDRAEPRIGRPNYAPKAESLIKRPFDQGSWNPVVK